jgi:hypothetical protein
MKSETVLMLQKQGTGFEHSSRGFFEVQAKNTDLQGSGPACHCSLIVLVVVVVPRSRMILG